ncbi:MAG TPA: phage holin family protein [Stellaceae bacterium]|nr:phage holin family protein [Stellaceae bacterium]
MTAPDDFAAEAVEERVYRGRPERPLGALLSSLTDDLSRLIRLEIALFKREMAVKARQFGLGAVLAAIGAVLAFTAWLAIFAAAVIALTIIWPAWLAAVVLGAVTLAVGGLLLFLGIRRLQAQRLVPQRTLGTLREDGAWIKERIL